MCCGVDYKYKAVTQRKRSEEKLIQISLEGGKQRRLLQISPTTTSKLDEADARNNTRMGDSRTTRMDRGTQEDKGGHSGGQH